MNFSKEINKEMYVNMKSVAGLSIDKKYFWEGSSPCIG